MGGEERQPLACSECAKRCSKIHGKKQPRHPPSGHFSFFKVMLGKFTEALFIPPKFACMLENLVNQNTYLEDSNGQHWKVKISKLDEHLAFHQGWNDFVLYHSIGVGEILVFNYISSSLFVVQVFGTSGCERSYFPEKIDGNIHKRKRDTIEPSTVRTSPHKDGRNSGTTKVQCHIIDQCSANKKKALETPDFSCFDNCTAEVTRGDPIMPESSACHDSGKFQEPKTTSANYSEVPCIVIAEDSMSKQDRTEAPMEMCTDVDMGRVIMTPLSSSHSDDSSKEKCDEENLIASNGLVRKIPLTEKQILTVDCPELQCEMSDKDLVNDQEVMVIPPINCVVSEILQTGFSVQNTKKLPMVEENSFDHADNLRMTQSVSSEEVKDNDNDIPIAENVAITTSPRRPQNASSEEFKRNDADITIEENYAIVIYPFTGVGISAEDCTKVLPCSDVKFSRRRERTQCAPRTEDPAKHTNVLGLARPKFLLSEDGICYIVDKESLEGNALANIENAPWAGNMSHAITEILKCHENPGVVDENLHQCVMEHDAVSQENEKKTKPHLKEASLKAVKIESLDSVGLSLPNSDFSFSIDANSQSWHFS